MSTKPESACYAVLTGDIVRSRDLLASDLDAVRSRLLQSVDAVSRWKRGTVKGKPEFFRGDAWQALLGRPASALRAAVYLLASLRAQGIAQTRVSIGVGRVDRVASKRVSLSVGEAFVLSGHGLDNMPKKVRMAIEAPESVDVLSDWLRVVGRLCDALIGDWTSRQAEIVCLALRPGDPTQAEIAEEMGVAQQTVTRALNGAKWNALREALVGFEKTAWGVVLEGRFHNS